MDLEDIKKSIQAELDQDFDALWEEFVQDTDEATPETFLEHLVEFGLVDESVVKPLLASSEDEPATQASSEVQPIDWSDDDDDGEEATVVARAEDLISLTKEAQTSGPPVPAAPGPPEAPPSEHVADAPEPDEPSAPDETPTPDAPPAPEDPDAATASPPEPEEPPEPELGSSGAEEPDDLPEPPGAPEAPPALEPPAYEDAPTGVGAPARSLGSLPVLSFRGKEADDNYTDRKRTQFRVRGDGQLEETGAFKRPERRQRRRAPPARTTRNVEHYNFVGSVGEGAMGAVHLVQDRRLHRKIAYKEMSDDIASQPALASKFLAEAQITAQLEHPNIVPVYALEGQKNAYTMKLIKGKTVEDLINEARTAVVKGRRLDDDHTLDARLDLFLKVCDAMAFSHARGVVHRDLKPENIMVGEFGEVYVMDWGIAHLLDTDDRPHVEGLLDEGDLIIGTAGYMSPEQADGKTSELTGASDQYALGLILHELVGLKPAVTGKNQLHIMTRQQLGEVNKLEHVAKKPIPAELIAIVEKSTRFEPAQRYPSVEDFADDIRRHLRGEAVIAKPDNPWQALVRFSGRHRQATLLAGMSVIFASLFLVLLIGVYSQVSASRVAAREQAVSNLVTLSGRQASAVEGQFVRFEGLLLILATTSEDMLTMGEPGLRDVYRSTDFAEVRPPGTIAAKRYGTDISLDTSVFHVAPSADTIRDEDLRQLEPMNRHYRKVMLRSVSQEAASWTPRRAERALADVGVPIQWAYLATANGAYNVFPGHGGYSPSFDARTTAWYRRAADAKGPMWGAPMVDEDLPSKDVVVPCSIPLRDTNGELLGVAGIDIRFDYLADELLVPDAFEGTSATVAIVDQDGNVLIDPSQKGASTPTPYSDPDVVEAIQARRSGYVESGDQITVYTRMASLDWYFVVSGPTSELLHLDL